LIIFSRYTTHRLTLQLKELTIDDAIYICNLPTSREEFCRTETLRRIVSESSTSIIGDAVDPLLWTAQERASVIAHYLTHTAEVGNPDFAIGEKNRYSDYILDGRDDHARVIDLGEYQGDHWFLHPLLGRGAECIERLIDSGQITAGRIGWFLGAMGCMMVRDADEDTTAWPEAQYEEYVLRRVNAFKAIAQSDFNPLFNIFWRGLKAQDHLLRLSFQDWGVSFDPAPEVLDQSPARFRHDATISDDTLTILGVSTEPQNGSDQV
jgi:hypothetical protein